MAHEAPRPTFTRFWLPVLVYVGVIFILSAQPGLRPPFKFEMSDKVAHVSEYFGLGLLLVRALRTLPRYTSILIAGVMAVAIGAGIGAADEVFQSIVPNRDSSVLDWIADTVGLSIAQLAYLWMKRP